MGKEHVKTEEPGPVSFLPTDSRSIYRKLETNIVNRSRRVEEAAEIKIKRTSEIDAKSCDEERIKLCVLCTQ